MSIYLLKGRFQDLLRPCVRRLERMGITANQVTVAAGLLSLAVAAIVFAWAPDRPLLYLLLPGWLLARMALNAVDGMLAREFGHKSPLGAYLNELCDAVSDAALYLALLSVPGVQASLLWAMALLALMTEYAGVLGLLAGASRRYDGPMGKSDRAFVVGLAGILLAGGWIGAATVGVGAAIVCLLCAVPVWRRVGKGLQEAGTCSTD